VGVGWAAVAAQLAARGFKITLVDRAAFPRERCAVTSSAQPRLVELADLGMAEMEGFRATNKIRDAALHLDGKKLIVRFLPPPGDDFGEPNQRKRKSVKRRWEVRALTYGAGGSCWVSCYGWCWCVSVVSGLRLG